jgi:hypothetical protein
MFTVVVPPLQAIVPADAEAVNKVGWETVIEVDEEHPRESVTVNEEVPDPIVKFPVPAYAVVPPVAETTATVVPPLHKIVPALTEAINTAGWVTVKDVVATQLLLSVTV